MISESKVREIRDLLNFGWSGRRVAKTVNVSRATVRRVKNGKPRRKRLTAEQLRKNKQAARRGRCRGRGCWKWLEPSERIYEKGDGSVSKQPICADCLAVIRLNRYHREWGTDARERRGKAIRQARERRGGYVSEVDAAYEGVSRSDDHIPEGVHRVSGV